MAIIDRPNKYALTRAIDIYLDEMRPFAIGCLGDAPGATVEMAIKQALPDDLARRFSRDLQRSENLESAIEVSYLPTLVRKYWEEAFSTSFHFKGGGKVLRKLKRISDARNAVSHPPFRRDLDQDVTHGALCQIANVLHGIGAGVAQDAVTRIRANLGSGRLESNQLGPATWTFSSVHSRIMAISETREAAEQQAVAEAVARGKAEEIAQEAEAARRKSEKQLQKERSAREDAEQQAAAEAVARRKAEEMVKEAEAARKNAEHQLQREATACKDAKLQAIAEAVARQEAEEVAQEADAARKEAEQQLKREVTARKNAEQQSAADAIARRRTESVVREADSAHRKAVQQAQEEAKARKFVEQQLVAEVAARKRAEKAARTAESALAEAKERAQAAEIALQKAENRIGLPEEEMHESRPAFAHTQSVRPVDRGSVSYEHWLIDEIQSKRISRSVLRRYAGDTRIDGRLVHYVRAAASDMTPSTWQNYVANRKRALQRDNRNGSSLPFRQQDLGHLGSLH